MIKLSYEDIVKKIKEKTGASDEEINAKIKQKLDQLAGLISKDGAAHIVANEMNVNVFEELSGPLKINKIIPGMRSIDVVGKVRAIYELREFNTQKGAGKVKSFLMGDETGNIRVTCWNSTVELIKDLKEGDNVKVKNTYAKDNNGRAEIHLSDKSEVELNPTGVNITLTEKAPAAMQENVRKKISELAENDNNIEILGTIVQAFEPRFFEVCPECGKRAKQRDGAFACDAHGNVTPDYSYVMNAIIDDGTETIRAVFFRDQAEQLIRKPKAEIVQYRQFKEKFDEVKVDLLGQMIKLSGRVTKNAMFDRLELVARNVDMNPNPEEEIKKLNKELGNTAA